MRITLNIAHGSFYALGAYGAASSLTFYFKGEWPPGIKYLAEKVELSFDAVNLTFQFSTLSLTTFAIVLIYFFTKLIASRYYLHMIKALAALGITATYIFLAEKFLWDLVNKEVLFWHFPFINQDKNALLNTLLSYAYPLAICLISLALVGLLIRLTANIRRESVLLALLLTIGFNNYTELFLYYP